MTSEQLDEIEKLADVEHGRGLDFGDLIACRNAIVPLVKALREARAALDRVSSDDRMSEAQITAAITEAQKERDEALESLRVARSDVACLWEERDEARAEVEREKASATRGWQTADELHLTVRDLKAEVERLRGIVEVNDRRLAVVWDEARVEVERLREAVRQVHALAGAVCRWPDVADAVAVVQKIHKITKGIVE